MAHGVDVLIFSIFITTLSFCVSQVLGKCKSIVEHFCLIALSWWWVWLFTAPDHTGSVPDCSRRLSSCFWCPEIFS